LPLLTLAEAVCTAPVSDETSGATALLFLGIKPGTRVRWATQGHGTWALAITADQCSNEGKLLSGAAAKFIVMQSLSLEPGKGEGIWILASPSGEIILAAHLSA